MACSLYIGEVVNDRNVSRDEALAIIASMHKEQDYLDWRIKDAERGLTEAKREVEAAKLKKD